MNNDREKLLKQANLDIIFFFLTVVAALVSFYLINEKKKSILNIDCITNKQANKIYRYNRILKFIIAGYFFLNAYYSYKEREEFSDNQQEELLVAATFFLLIGALLYLPLGNSNLIIEN
ncbi:MAG: hypothetical protein IJZ46_03710 [Bacilli bacterium]|nr:hypothetical protein [Bacilli bacterium]